MIGHQDEAASAIPFFSVGECRFSLDKEVLAVAGHVHSHVTLVAHHYVVVGVFIEEVVQADVAINVLVVVILLDVAPVGPRVGCEFADVISLQR